MGNSPDNPYKVDLDVSAPRGQVQSIWYPMLTNGNPDVLKPNGRQDFFFRVTGSNGGNLRTVSAWLTEMHNENPDLGWLPKTGAAYPQTLAVNVYAPHGGIRVTGLLEYHRPVSIGVMLHLGFI